MEDTYIYFTRMYYNLCISYFLKYRLSIDDKPRNKKIIFFKTEYIFIHLTQLIFELRYSSGTESMVSLFKLFIQLTGIYVSSRLLRIDLVTSYSATILESKYVFLRKNKSKRV